ncbi:MAG: sortase [Candidatus Pacebacteria bacterium]|nr:sortase [Candidatus Paceibacterota bacterium]
MLKSSKILLKYFLILSAIFLVIFNWGYIDWFFNYKTVGENLGYLARKTIGQNEVSVYFSEIALLSLPNQSSSTTQQVQPKPKPVDITRPSYISIPIIGVNAPISFTQSRSQKVFASLLNVGVLHYPDSTLPGTVGTTIILGHSAPPNWPKIRYDSVFNNLKDLKPGDEISIDFHGEIYKYIVRDTFFVKAGQDLSQYLTFNRNMLLLVSCWPPGHNLQRIVVEAELSN